MMNIRIAVWSAQAQAKIAALEAELAMLRKQSVATGVTMNKMGSYGLPFLSKWGNQVQWAGRQLQYNFTLPLVIAGGAATKFALDNEKAMTRVIKVYGDGSEVFNELAETEIPALSRAFEELSNQFGVNQAATIQIAGDWAAAGASGVALAKAVKLTLETMILGELEAAEATQSLIAIQAQYGQSTEQLAKTIDILNMVENQTGISMQGLIQGFARAAGVARSAGIDVEHLAAMLAALTPAAGSAANAGNALKTMISRLLSPTKEANEVLKLMHINTKEMAWQSLNGAQRLETLAKSFRNLDDAQKAVVASVVASRWQINRFDVLMRDITNTNGYYQRSLNATSDASRNFAQRVKELNIVLSSNPQRLKQTWTILQNALADVIQPLIPYIVYLAQEIAKLGRAFADLDPMIQKTILAGLVLLALIGPVARYVGSITTLFGILSGVLHFAGAKFLGLGKIISMVLFGPFKLLGSVLLQSIGWAAGFAIRFPKLIVSGFRVAYFGYFAVMRGWYASMVVWWAATKGLWAANLIFLRGLAVRWAAVMTMIWAGSASGMTGIWTKLWASMVAIQRAGLVAMAVISGRFTVLLSLFVFLGKNILIAWRGFTAALVAVHAIALGRLRALSVLFAVGQIGIFTRLGRTIVIIWQAMTAALVAIWRLGIRGLLATTVSSFKQVAAFLIRFGKWFVSWPALLFFAVLGIAYAFRDKLKEMWSSIVDYFTSSQGGIANAMRGIGSVINSALESIARAFWKLPSSVTGAIMAVLNVIKSAALAIYEWLSYLNPFARHSPSLVESVTAGMDEITRQYGRAKGIGNIFKQVASHLAKYKQIAASMGTAPWQEERVNVAEAYKSALPLFDSLVQDWKQLNNLLDKQKAKVDAQQAVVDLWSKKLDAANAALDRERSKLDKLQDQLTALNDAYAAHQQALEDYANAPLVGMHNMEEAIFANEMAQKELRLEMLRWEQVNGSLDDMQSRLQSIAGDLEVLRGEAASLRAGGAGSDITGPIEAQIAAMEQQSQALQDTINNSPINQMQQQLEELQVQAEIMDLEKALQFEPLQHQIENLVNTTKELTFEEIIAGIQSEQAAMASLQPQIDSVTAAIAQQEAAVKAAEAARDAVQAQYDLESTKLDKLQEQYQKTEQAIRDVESALRDMGQAASEQLQKLSGAAGAAGAMSPGAENFQAAAGANFPDVGGMAQIGREGGLGDQSALIDEFTQGITDDIAKSFGSFDIFAPLKAKWNDAWAWVKEHVGSKVGPVGDAIGAAFGSIGNPFSGLSGNSTFLKGWSDIWDTITDVVSTALDWIKKVIDLFAPDVKRVFNAFVDAGKKIWDEIGPELAKFGKLWAPLGKAIKNVWKILKPLIAIMAVGLLAAFKIVASVASKTLGPILNTIIGIVKNVIKVFRGFIEIVIGIFSGDWKLVWQGVKDIVSGTFGAIWEIIKGAGEIIWGIVSGIVTGIVEFFQWLWDVLVGHSIIPDIINGIFFWFDKLADLAQWVWDHVLMPIYNFFKKIWEDYIQPALAYWWAGIKIAWNALKTAASWLWDNVLKPIWNKVKAVWDDYVKPAFRYWWEGLKIAWNALKTAASWLWDNVLKPIWNKVKGLWDDYVKPSLGFWWEGIKNIWSGLTTLGKWVWDNVLKPVWDKFGDLLAKIKGLGGDFFDAGKSIFEKMIKGITSAAGAVADLANAIWDKLKDVINTYVIDPIRSALNFTIDPPGPMGPWHFNLGDKVPRLYTGGVVKGSRLGTLAVLGDRGHDEAVVPLSGPYAPRDSRIEAGVSSMSQGDTHYHFYGDLSFPNITDGSDAETFLKNLEILAEA